MDFESKKRKLASPNPWQRYPKEASITFDDMNYLMNHTLKRPKFAALLVKDNICLDIYTKRAVLKASPSIVGLISYSGKEEIFQGSGTIIESDGNSGVILTSATLIRCRMGRNSVADDVKVVAHLSNGNSFDCQILAFDFHYNIAALKIQSESDAPLPIACLAHLDDSISVDPNQLYIPEEKPFQLRPHSKSFNLIPGDTLIALGRYFIKPYDVMATIGEFSLDRCEYDCKELLRVNCQITRCGIGGPFINYYGEVIGICFHDLGFTPFLPINVASKWWEHYKICGEPRRPWLGMEVTNLYAADVDILEKIVYKFLDVFKGVIVEEVMAGSSADSAGISPNDVIVQFGGKTIKSFLELFEAMWDKVGDPVEVIVIRASNSVPLRLSMVVDEATSDNLYSWPLWEHAR